MTCRQLKANAQHELMHAMRKAFDVIADAQPFDTAADYELVRDEMDVQLARVEKLFGYDIGTWNRSGS